MGRSRRFLVKPGLEVLAADLHPKAVLLTQQLGDVVGVQFANEEELALFIPESGDVLLCDATQWHLLKTGQLGCTPDPVADLLQAGDADRTSAINLKATLLGLGARLA